jgi:phosphate/sulfate permease
MSAELIYLFMVVILFLLATSDLVVGVSNDAINFLNSAIGSRAARFRTVMIVAMIGILIGATFSSGMMEIARKGMFNPQFFYFKDIMIIFLGVMIMDVILLDTFNSFGLPTSTTVSLIFELLGASVAIAIAYNMRSNLISVDGSLIVGSVSDYINSKKAFEVIMGILLSIAFAFTIGAIVQYLVRLLFTFNYRKVLPYAGGIFSGIAITSITYFMLIKGAKDASFMTPEMKLFIQENSTRIIIGSIIGWTVLFQALTFIIKEGVLRIIVLAGTFSLAMAFAGNDLVNFIGVPIAGFNAYTAFITSGGVNPGAFTMEALSKSIHTEGYMLVLAGIIMAITLWKSKKARTVIHTTIDLTRQNEGEEQFSSNYLARSIVRIGRHIGSSAGSVVPGMIKRAIDKRFQAVKIDKGDQAPAFDLVRASVILVVSSALIAYATSYKLPLSTTYVTFMTAMGASFADRAWGRESAVYRISGVLNVVGGWFLTALAAFSGAFLIATSIYYGGLWVTFLFIGIALFTVIRTHAFHHKKAGRRIESDRLNAIQSISSDEMQSNCLAIVNQTLRNIDDMYGKILQALFAEKRKKLSEYRGKVKSLRNETQLIKSQLPELLRKLDPDALPPSFNYVQIIENLNELSYTLNFISKHAFEHVDNNHKEFSQEQIADLNEIIRLKSEMVDLMVAGLDNPSDLFIEEMYQHSRKLIHQMDECIMRQIKRVKAGTSGKRTSMLFMNIISETKNMISFELNMLRAHHQFMKMQQR